MDHLSQHPPGVAVLHYQKVIGVGDEMGHERFGPVGVEVTSLVKKLFENSSIADNDGGILEAFEREDTSVVLGPFHEPEM